MTHTAHAYVASVNILELPCAYACAYLTSEKQALRLKDSRKARDKHVCLFKSHISMWRTESAGYLQEDSSNGIMGCELEVRCTYRWFL